MRLEGKVAIVTGGGSGIGAEIILKDFSGLSNGVQIFTTSDNYLKAAIPGGTLNKSKNNDYTNEKSQVRREVTCCF